MKLRETIQPLVNKARGTHCEQCLSKKQLQVKLVFELEDLASQFAVEYPADEFDKVSRSRKHLCSFHNSLRHATIYISAGLGAQRTMGSRTCQSLN